MAGQGPLLSRLQAVLAAYDDDALAALANKGLVRRARKDLESNRPVVVGPEGEYLRLQVGDATVDIGESPAQSRCSCPSGSICRHVLIALLFLKESAAPTAVASAGTAASPVETIDDEALRKWAGTALLRKANQALAAGLPIEISENGPIVFRFVTRNITCRWMPEGGLAGMVCSCHAAGPCEHKVAAVLSYQTAKGQRIQAVETAMLEASAGAPRSRDAVLTSVGAVLREMIALGLSRLSSATEQRLRTLAVSAHGVDLPRLEKLLRALADEAVLALRRDAQSNTSTLLATAARVEALRCALARPTPALVGVHRSQYEKVGDIEVVGMGARRWRTRSGYSGLTVYFWDRSLNNWATWTEARSIGTSDFEPKARYRQDGPWSGCNSPEEAVRQTLRLTGAWRNRGGRLSGRPGTRALAIALADPLQVPGALERWDALANRAVRLFGGGFRDRGEQEELVLLVPGNWAPAEFDPIRQELKRTVYDRAGRPLPLILTHTPENVEAIEVLEKHDPSLTHGLLGLLRLQADTLAVEPVALYLKNRTLSLTLDGEDQPRPTPAVRNQAEDAEELLPVEEAEMGCSTSRVGRLLASLESELEMLADAGVGAAHDLAQLRGLANRAEALGLTCCSRSVQRLVDALIQLRQSSEPDPAQVAEALLRSSYLARLAATQEAIAEATAFLTANRDIPGPTQS